MRADEGGGLRPLLQVVGAGHADDAEVHVTVHDLAVQDVGRAHEARHERRGRVVVDLVGRADLLDLALVHHDDLVRELQRLLLVVGDEEARDAELAVELVEPAAQVLADARVEGAERLVEQQDAGLGGERAGEGHALALPAGELVGVALGEGRELDELEQLLDALALHGLGLLAHGQAEGDVLADRHVPEEGVVLEDEADLALLDALVGELLVADPDPSRPTASRGPRSCAGPCSCRSRSAPAAR